MAGLDIDLAASVDPEFIGDMGIPASAALLAFANAVQTTACGRAVPDPDDASAISEARRTLADQVGEQATKEAAATIAIFNGLVRVADGTGIQLDGGMFATSAHDREALGINEYGGAANSTDVAARTDAELTEVASLFSEPAESSGS